MKPLSFAGKWVLVTGASSGLGRAMAVQLACEHRANIVAIARRRELLEELKADLAARAGVEVEIIAADLSRLEEVDRAIAQATQGRVIEAAILNAGITYFGEHLKLDWSAFEGMLRTNVSAVVRMATDLVPHFEQNGVKGGLLIVSSLAGVIPVPYQAAYSATKAFVLSFGSALAAELHEKEVSVTVYVPGGIKTEMTSTKSFRELESFLVPVDGAAREALNAFRRRKAIHIPGIANRMSVILSRFVPQRLLVSLVGGVYRKALKNSLR